MLDVMRKVWKVLAKKSKYKNISAESKIKKLIRLMKLYI